MKQIKLVLRHYAVIMASVNEKRAACRQPIFFGQYPLNFTIRKAQTILQVNTCSLKDTDSQRYAASRRKFCLFRGGVRITAARFLPFSETAVRR